MTVPEVTDAAGVVDIEVATLVCYSGRGIFNNRFPVDELIPGYAPL